MIATKRNMETGDNSHGSSGYFCAKRVPANLARRGLVSFSALKGSDRPVMYQRVA